MFRSKEADPTVIGAGAVIEGIVRVNGRVQVDGYIEGTLEVDGEVSIGPKGAVHGELLGTTLVVGGRVTGRIIAQQHLHVVSTGIVQGDVRYESLQVDRGGVIGGTTSQSEDHEHEAPALAAVGEDAELPSAASC